MKTIIYSCFCAFLCMAFVACKNSGTSSSENNTAATIKIHRFDKLLFEAPINDLQAHLQKNEKEFSVFFDAPLTDTNYIHEIKLFITDSLSQEIYDSVSKKYANLDWLSTELTEVFDNAKKYLPNQATPEIFTLVSNDFDYGTRIIGSHDFLAIALQMYAVSAFEKYSYFELPAYMVQMLNKQFITVDCMDTWIQQLFPAQTSAETFLEKIIERGKYLYFKDLTLTSTPDNLKIRYTQEQLKWCEENESLIWGFFIQQNLLFEKDFLKIRNFLNEGPKTPGFAGAPGRLGDYIGWQIVKQYVKKTDVSFVELMKQTNAQQILKESGYKPKQK